MVERLVSTSLELPVSRDGAAKQHRASAVQANWNALILEPDSRSCAVPDPTHASCIANRWSASEVPNVATRTGASAKTR